MSPAPPPSAGRDQAGAEQAIKDGYLTKLANCYATRDAAPNIRWRRLVLDQAPHHEPPLLCPGNRSADGSVFPVNESSLF